MFWIFAAVALILCVASKGFRKVMLWSAAALVLFVALLINEGHAKREAVLARQEAARHAEPAPKPTLDELLAD